MKRRYPKSRKRVGTTNKTTSIMSEIIAPSLLAELTIQDANSTPKDQLLKSYNIFKLQKPDRLLRDLKPCLNKDIPTKHVSLSNDAQGFNGQYIEQSSVRETKQELSASVGIEGKYGVYSASVQVDYSKSEATSSTSFFSCYVAKLDIGTLTYSASTETTLGLLDPEMVTQLHAINSMAKAKAFTDTWGTHLVTRLNLGGMLFVSLQSETSSIQQKEKLSATIKAKYEGVGSLNAVASVVTEMAKSESTTRISQNIAAMGGSAVKAGSIKIAELSTYEAWIATCNENTAFSVSDSIEIYTLANGDARKHLKKYIDLTMLAYSLEHPTIFVEQMAIQAYNTNILTAPNKHTEGYKIIGGGAGATNGCSSYLMGSYPQLSEDRRVTGWHAVSHDIAHAALPAKDTLSSYAIAIYDPENYLQVGIASGVGSNSKVGADWAEAKLGNEWTLTCGGISCQVLEGPAKFVTGSYFVDAHTWRVECSDYKRPATKVVAHAFAIGVKSLDSALTISSTMIKGAQGNGQHGNSITRAQTCVCGGGVRVWDNKGMGNLVQITAPSSPTGWEEANHDMDGSISYANYQSCAIALKATVNL